MAIAVFVTYFLVEKTLHDIERQGLTSAGGRAPDSLDLLRYALEAGDELNAFLDDIQACAPSSSRE